MPEHGPESPRRFSASSFWEQPHEQLHPFSATHHPGDGHPVFRPRGIRSYTEDLVVWQLGEFREERAVPDLKRIIQFDTETETGRFCRTHETLVANAKEALTKIGANA